MIVNSTDNEKKNTNKQKSTNMDNNLKSVPQRKLLRDDQKALLQFILNRSEECGAAIEECEER